MTKPIDKTSTELFQLLRSRFSPVNLGNQDAESTSDPAEARFFSFIYKENGRALGPISISIVNNRSLKIFYSNDVVDGMKDSASWYEFLKELRFFSKRNLLAFDARDINKDQLDTRDYDFIKKIDGPYQERDVEVTESSMFGSRRKSYQTVGNAKLVVAHRKSVDENIKGARSRYIESIFVECNGERFRFPVNYLNGARAMAVHVSEGGTPYDDIGQHIISTVAEMANLSKFARMTRKHAMEDAEAGDIRSKVIEAYNAKKKSIMRLHNPKNYKEFAENFVKSDEPGSNDTTQLKERFTLKVWNENMEDLLPSVQRALEGYTMTEDNTGPETDDEVESMLEYAWDDEDAAELEEAAFSSAADIDEWVSREFGGDYDAALAHAIEIANVGRDTEWVPIIKYLGTKTNSVQEAQIDEAAPSVERQITDPNFVLVLRKDPAADAMIRNAKFTNGGGLLGFVLSDIASRAIGNDIDAVANFASEMALQVGEEGQSFGTKMTPEYKKDKQLAMLLAKKYLDDMKKMAQDPAYAAIVRKDPGEVYGAKKTRTGGFHEAVASFENWANALLEAGTTGTTGTVAPGTMATKSTNPTIVKALSGGDPNKARDLKRVADKLARGQRLSPQEAPIAGEIAKDVVTSKKTNAATQALAQDKYTQMDAVEEGKWDYPKDMTKTKEVSDMGTTNAAKNREKRKEWRKEAKAKKHKDLKAGKVTEGIWGDEEEEGASKEDIYNAILYRLQANKTLNNLLRAYGLDAVENAIESVAEFHTGATELGTSDISIMVKQVHKELGIPVEEATITEKALKVADQDYDGDGELESPEDEYAGSKDNAIKKAMKKPAATTEDEQLMAESLALLKKFAGI